MPILGLGTWKSEPGEVYKAIRSAINIGYRHFDCAAIYGNEKEIGGAFADAFKAGDVSREALWVTSKLWNTAHRKGQVRPALEKTLNDLQLDYLDLYLMHWPVAIVEGAPFPFKADAFISLEEIPISETWAALESCRDAGLAKHIGVANFTVKKLKALMAESGTVPEMNQIELHPLLQQNDMLAFCKNNNIHLTAYSPLGSKDRPGVGPEIPNLFEQKEILQIAESQSCTPAQVLIKWAIQRGTAVIPKSVNTGRMQQNLDAMKVDLTESEMAVIPKMDRNYRFIDGSFFTPPGSPYTLENLWGE